MNHELSRFREQSNEQSQAQSSSNSKAQGQEFATPEEMLRADSEQNPVPPAVAERLKASIAAEPRPKAAWYKKIFGASN